MNKSQYKYVPVLSSVAGSCLTAQNWHEVGVDVGSYSLDSLLQKPGAESFSRFMSLANYIGWSKDLILNASSLIINSKGLCEVKSVYDGSKYNYSTDDIINFITMLKPQAVILPHGFYQYASYPQLPESIQIFFPYTDSPELNDPRPFGISFIKPDVLIDWDLFTDRPIYVMNVIFNEQKILKRNAITYLESDKVALDAYNGVIYTPLSTYNLLSDTMVNQFETLAPDCECITCRQKLTRSYMHHLLQHTPLLCMRFLIQHNVWCFVGGC